MTSELTSAPTEAEALAWENEYLRETLSTLELQLESQGWQTLSGTLENEFSIEGLRAIRALARMYWLKNPLIRRGVDVQAYYVFGQGVEISAADEELDEVVQEFVVDAKNQDELFSHAALLMKERELQLFGDLFFVLFADTSTGRVRIRTIPPDEIDDIICNPDDAKDPWWYRRVWQERAVSGPGRARTTYYRDWRYSGGKKPDGETETAPIYHVKVGGLSDMKFGVSEVYAALDWAKAYKSFLEDWATIVRAYSRFAWNLTVPTKAGIVTAKAKLSTTIGSSGSSETNPPPVTGSTFIGQPGVSMQPMRTAGATTSAEDGRRLMLMVASTMGLPESFFGDVSVGNLATARSLDRPTELKMASRQSFWRDVLQALLAYVVEQAVRAGVVKGRVIEDTDGTPTIELPPLDGEEDRDLTINVDFPPILEHDVAASVEAIVKAATLGGSALASTIDAETVTRLLLTALGEQDIQAIMDVIYPKDEDGNPLPVETEPMGDEPEGEVIPALVDEQPATEALMVDAVRELRAAIAQFVEGRDAGRVAGE